MRQAAFALVSALLLSGCNTAGDLAAPLPTPADPSSVTPAPSSAAPSATPFKQAAPRGVPTPGNPGGHAPVPVEARVVDTSRPTRVVGAGTAASCTSDAVVDAVRDGGIVTFDCGASPVTITLASTATVRNASAQLVLDGGGKVTLSGGGKRRILYVNTCVKPATSHCQDQSYPSLTLQNLTFADGDSSGEPDGGGAVFARGGHLMVINSRFTDNQCDSTGPDLGGAALRVLSQTTPVYVVGSTFTGGRCSNGGALSSIGVSWVILNSVFSDNSAIGRGANPAKAGTPGGGSGGALYLDGDTIDVTLNGTAIEKNTAREGGGAIFFVSNDRTGTLAIKDSTLRANRSTGFETSGYPGIFYLGAGKPTVTGSTLEK